MNLYIQMLCPVVLVKRIIFKGYSHDCHKIYNEHIRFTYHLVRKAIVCYSQFKGTFKEHTYVGNQEC